MLWEATIGYRISWQGWRNVSWGWVGILARQRRSLPISSFNFWCFHSQDVCHSLFLGQWARIACFPTPVVSSHLSLGTPSMTANFPPFASLSLSLSACLLGFRFLRFPSSTCLSVCLSARAMASDTPSQSSILTSIFFCGQDFLAALWTTVMPCLGKRVSKAELPREQGILALIECALSVGNPPPPGSFLCTRFL